MALHKKDAEFLENTKKQYKEQFPNKTDEEIEHMVLDMLFHAYCEDVIDRHALTVLIEGLGYEVVDEVLDKVEKEKKEGKHNEKD